MHNSSSTWWIYTVLCNSTLGAIVQFSDALTCMSIVFRHCPTKPLEPATHNNEIRNVIQNSKEKLTAKKCTTEMFWSSTSAYWLATFCLISCRDSPSLHERFSLIFVTNFIESNSHFPVGRRIAPVRSVLNRGWHWCRNILCRSDPAMMTTAATLMWWPRIRAVVKVLKRLK